MTTFLYTTAEGGNFRIARTELSIGKLKSLIETSETEPDTISTVALIGPPLQLKVHSVLLRNNERWDAVNQRWHRPTGYSYKEMLKHCEA
jgi:hypothetical protein